jgi:hypothetical protein
LTDKQATLRGLIISFFDEFKILLPADKQAIVGGFVGLQKINSILTDDHIICDQFYLDSLPEKLRLTASLL